MIYRFKNGKSIRGHRTFEMSGGFYGVALLNFPSKRKNTIAFSRTVPWSAWFKMLDVALEETDLEWSDYWSNDPQQMELF